MPLAAQVTTVIKTAIVWW